METELKLLIATADLAVFRRLALLKQFAIRGPTTRLLRATYFDTPELFLHKHHMALRVRRIGRVSVQTLKADGPATAGLYQRKEWEGRVAGPGPDITSLIASVGKGTTWEKVLGERGLAQRLVPIFSDDVRRTVWTLLLAAGTEVELALDQGELTHGDSREPISEVELELKAGSPSALFDLAQQVQEELPLRVGNLSKSARGYALHDVHSALATTAVKVSPVVLNGEQSVEQGFRLILSHCLTQMQDNEVGVVRGVDPESIHQMRVGMRRLRSVLRLFRPWIPFPMSLQQELVWLGSELGAARDADVLADSTLRQVVDACPQETDLLPLQQTASTMAGVMRQRAAAAVSSVRYSRLMLGLVGWLQAARWRESLDESALDALADPLQKHATRILHRCHAKLIKSGRRMARGTPEERHQVRIAAKKARYATEFFQSLFRRAHTKRYLRRLAALQDTLGGLNDAVVADQGLRQLQKRHPKLVGSAGFARGYLCAAARQNELELMDVWRRFNSTAPP